MSSLTRSRHGRWLVPVAVAATVAAITGGAQLSASADDHPVLTPRTAGELLQGVRGVKPQPLSGSVHSTVALGLPSLPTLGGSNSSPSLAGLMALVTGTHTADVWENGPDQQRVGLHAQLAETEFVHNGKDVWTYDSSANAVTHRVLQAGATAHDAATAHDGGPALPSTPAAAASAALAAIDPTTAVTVDSTAKVAGRSAYRLVLTPKDGRTLVGSVSVAIDAETSIPLQVQVFARGAAAASIDVGFDTVRFAPVDASVFAFTPPAGATVTDAATAPHAGLRKDNPDTQTPPPSDPQLIGTGWTAVASVRLPATEVASSHGPGRQSEDTSTLPDLLNSVSSPVAGGRVITTNLLTVLVTNDGRVFVGAVSPADLQKVVASGQPL